MEFDSKFAIAAIAALVAGFVRGFTGFGGALIFTPVVAAVFGPQFAAPIYLVLDYTFAAPIFIRSIRICRWSTVLPTAIAGIATAPIGAWLLANSDPILLRWVICILVVLLLALVVSGWRYHGKPNPIASFGVGGVSGLFGGIGQVSGPPVIAFWMSGPETVTVIRANMFCFFGLLGISSFTAYFLNGLFTFEGLKLILALAPIYAASLYSGGWLFGRTKGANYRPIAYAVVAFAAFSSMPAFDSILR